MPFNKQNPLSRGHRRSRSRAKGTRPEGHEGGAAVGRGSVAADSGAEIDFFSSDLFSVFLLGRSG